MARPEITGRRISGNASSETATTKPQGLSVERAAYTIAEFCEAHRISLSFYYKLKALGLGPVENHNLGKITITNENAAKFRRANEVTENPLADELLTLSPELLAAIASALKT